MRIRKNAKLSPLLFSSSSSQGGSVPVETLQTHVCQLNQSPWDVIPFDSDSIQFEGEDSFTAGNNGSNGDSIGAVESVASPKTEDMVLDDNQGVAAEMKNLRCESFDAKGLLCKNEAKHGQSFCNHHSSLPRSYNNSGSGSYNKKSAAAVTATGVRRATRPRAAAKKAPSSSSNPYEFYYYSGFGPMWGKRRSDRHGGGGEGGKNSIGGEENSAMVVEVENNVPTTLQAPPDGVVAIASNNNNNSNNVVTSSSPNEGFDYVDDDDEEEDDKDHDESGKKRMRKPVKARSLKSLM